mmetsp:Transcript_72401/g.212130  ORF Transcript_72401/g.212130 Transcript_72401/m.212130 type:complete len:311 (+) Transcript_72401:75-1007(+)
MALSYTAFLSAFAALALAMAEQPDAMERAALAEGDECNTSGSDAGSCALNALQRGRHKLESQTHGESSTDEDSGSIIVDIPPSEPDTKMYSNMSLDELGLDELNRLIEAARRVVDERLAGTPEYSPQMKDAADAAVGCPFRKYTGPMYGSNLCFCKLAGNAGCMNSRCTCPQGCGRGVVWGNSQTVTFKNRARAVGCSPSAVLLTASRTYYSTTRQLKDACGGGAAGLLQVMLQNSWDWYQSKVGSGPVNQCFHNPNIASVKYLHLQTFCAKGEFHAMPTGNRRNSVGFCVTMSSRGQAGELARKLAGWL